MTRREKVARFRALHAEQRAFLMPNPWDVGSVKLLEHLGFEALGTTSAGHAYSLGRADQKVTLDEAIAHARLITIATDLPVSGDWENGFADTPSGVAQAVSMAADSGLAGVSIEDLHPGGEPYPLEEAVARIEAAVAMAKDVDIVVCARADGVMQRQYGLDEAERRLARFAEVGAECIYCPVLPDLAAVKRFTALGAPLNVLMGSGAPDATVEQLRAAGVSRISLGDALARTAYGAAFSAAQQIIESGEFGLANAGVKESAFDPALA